VLSVAGVVTTEAARPTALTRNALIEAAAFDPAAVRRATQALRVTTLASLRFERGSDATATRRGIRRALQLLTASGRAPAAVLEDRRVVGDPSPREIVCGPAGAERLLGVPTDEVEFLDRLRWFGYAPTADGTGVSVPPWRVWDVTEPADVYEDLAQSRDYNSTPGALPLDVAGILPSPSEEAQERVTAALVTHGFLEVIGDAFESDADARLTAGRRVPSAVATGELLRLQNSVDPRQGMLRRSTLTTALRIIGDNVRDGVRDGRIFEWGRVYSSSSSSSAAAVDETSVVWAAVFSRRENRAALLRSVQQVVEHLAHASGTPLRLREAELGTDSVLHAHQSATIDVDGRSVGLVGTVAPGVSDGILPGLSICYCELDVDALVASMLASRSRPPAPVRASNAMRRQLSYWVEDRVTVASLLGALRSAAAERPERISFAVESTFTSADSRSVTVEVVLDRSEWPNRTVASQVVVEIGERAAREHGRVALRTAEPVRAVPTAVR
jgi:phenylalanyl-tRNA synthetase beta chain